MARKYISQRVRFEVLKRDGFACVYCGRRAPIAVLVMDHIEPRAKGGPDHIDNYATACSDCNAGKSDTPILPSDVEWRGYPYDSVEYSILNNVETAFHHDLRAFLRCVKSVMEEYPEPQGELVYEMSGGQVWAEWELWCIQEGGRRHRLEVLAEYGIDPDAADGWGYPMQPAQPMAAWMLEYYLGVRQ